jgi:hypothetical protein
MAELFTGVETHKTGITGDKHTKEPVRDLPIDGIFIAVDVDLTSDSINEGYKYWVGNNTHSGSKHDQDGLEESL